MTTTPSAHPVPEGLFPSIASDDPLAPALNAYRQALPPGDLVVFSTAPFDRLGIDSQTVTLFTRDGRTRGGLSYGFSPSQALVGALGEMTEEFSASRAVTHRPREAGSYRELVSRFGARHVADPLTLCLEAGAPYTPDRPLQWFETRRLRTQEPVWVPLEWVATYRGDVGDRGGLPPLVTPITNGLGAGLTREQALTHGLLELLQRDGNGLAIRALATGTALDPATITDPLSRSLLDRLEGAGVEVVIKVAATEFGVANLYVVGIDRDERRGGVPIMAAAGGEAAHPVREIALRKALLEFSAARARLAFFHGPLEAVRKWTPPGYLERILAKINPAGEEPRALESMLRWIDLPLPDLRRILSERVLRVDRRVPFTELPGSPEALAEDKPALLSQLAERLSQAGLDILVADFSDLTGGAFAVKVIVPGLEVETMSYGRIGERNLGKLLALAEAGGPRLAGVGPRPEGAKPVLLTPEAEARLGGAAWLDWPAVERVAGGLYSLYREPSRHTAPLVAGQRRGGGVHAPR